MPETPTQPPAPKPAVESNKAADPKPFAAKKLEIAGKPVTQLEYKLAVDYAGVPAGSVIAKVQIDESLPSPMTLAALIQKGKAILKQ